MLFVNGNFTDRSDIDDFTNWFVEYLKDVTSVKVVVQGTGSIMIIFDADYNLPTRINGLLSEDDDKFYFLFDSASILNSRVPDEIKSIMFGKTPNDSLLYIEIARLEIEHNMDEILEKIEKLGVKSLTKSEKNYLDSFKK